MMRLYAPALVLVIFVGVAALGGRCPVGFGVLMTLAVLTHVRALIGYHTMRFHRRHRS